MYALIASTFTITKAALAFSSPLFLIGFRMSLAGIFLLAYLWINNKFNYPTILSFITSYLMLALVYICIPYFLEFWAMEVVGSARAALIYNLTPFFTVIFAFYGLRERLNLTKSLGLLVGFAGYIPIFSSCFACDNWYFISAQDLALLGATASGAYSWILIKRLMNQGRSIVEINGISMFLGGLISLIASAFFDGFGQVENWPAFTGLVFFVIIVGNIISYNLYSWLLKQYSATFLSFCGFT